MVMYTTPITHFMRDKMNIGIFGAKTYPPEIGGIETHIYYLSRELIKKDIYVTIFTGRGEKTNSFINEINQDNNLRVYRVGVANNKYLLKLSMVPKILILIKRLNKNKQTRIDVYHAHDAVFGFFLSILGYRPLVYTAHGCGFLRSDWPKLIKKTLKFMETTIFKKANEIICVDYKTKEIISKYRKKSTYVIPNGVQVEAFENLERPPEYPQNKIIIFSSGRLIPSKGFEDLIKAYMLLDEDIKERAELFIAGKGPLLETLRKKASEEKRIHILGYVPKIEPYFTHADVFVLPSHYEGFPFTLLEAMAAKTACIATDVGDIGKRFKDGEIIIVPARNFKKLSKALKRVITNKDLRNNLSSNAYRKVSNEYSWKKISEETLEIYKSLS